MKFGKGILKKQGCGQLNKILNFNRTISIKQQFKMTALNKELPKTPLLKFYGTCEQVHCRVYLQTRQRINLKGESFANKLYSVVNAVS